MYHNQSTELHSTYSVKTALVKKKKKKRPQMESLVLSHVTDQDLIHNLIAVSTSPRNIV